MTFPKPGGGDRPSTLPSRPGGGDRPSTLPSRPGGGDRPSTLPNKPGVGAGIGAGIGVGIGGGIGDRPGGGIGDRPGNRPGQLPSRPDFGNRPGGGIGDRPGGGIGDRPGGGNNNWWNGGRNNVNIGSGNTVNINRNFQNSINFSTSRRNWGYNPWWNRPSSHRWYGGSWRCGWVRPPIYRRPAWPGYYPVGRAVAWGLVGWGLGNLFFNCGYYHYSNPYPVQTVYVASSPSVTYTEPITKVAEAAAPSDDAAAIAQAEKVETFIGESQAAFKEQNYLVALELANKAIAESPGDGGLHEYRALILFALAKYSETAGVLNPILVSSPGWDWSTMVQLYDKQETYTAQLRKLEEYNRANTESATASFVLGYHYLVCGYLEESAVAFHRAAELEPADQVAVQLASLAENSTTSAETEVASVDEDKAEKAEESKGAPEGEPSEEVTEVAQADVPFEKIVGKWTSDQGDNGVVTLTINEDGKFLWQYESKTSDPFKMEGDYNLGEGNVLTLTEGESQMAGTVALPAEGTMNFVLAGGPPGDPGLTFKKG